MNIYAAVLARRREGMRFEADIWLLSGAWTGDATDA
jgi:hypothetical protein